MHVITFIRRLKAFTQENGITSELKVDRNNTVEDVGIWSNTGNIIADIDNGIGELKDALYKYYEETGNAKELGKLNDL